MDAWGLRAVHADRAPAPVVWPATLAQCRHRRAPECLEALGAIQAAAALAAGRGRPAPLRVAPFPSEPGRQRVTDATTLSQAPKTCGTAASGAASQARARPRACSPRRRHATRLCPRSGVAWAATAGATAPASARGCARPPRPCWTWAVAWPPGLRRPQRSCPRPPTGARRRASAGGATWRPRAPRLTHGKKRGPGHIVQAYAPPMAPLSPGKSHGPAQCGRHIGLRSAPVSGLRLAPRVPTGQPREPRAGWPMRDKGPQASALVTSPTRWPLHALGGERGGNDAARRHALPARGMFPWACRPRWSRARRCRAPQTSGTASTGRASTVCAPPHPVPLACASGSRRPGVERHRATLMSRGADHVRDKGLEGAGVQSGMTVIAPNGAVLVRLCPQRLSKRGQKCRR